MCWDQRAHALSIAAKELIPIILACHTWGSAGNGRRVLCNCYNQVVVASRTSRDASLMHLIKCLVFVEALHNCFLYPQYICTRDNHLADDLSKNAVSSFLSKVPSANPLPTTWSQHLVLDPRADWTSLTWRRLYSSTSSTVHTQNIPTKRFYSFCTSYNIQRPLPFDGTSPLLFCIPLGIRELSTIHN